MTGKNVSEEVVLQLISSKCLPTLLYGAEVSGLSNRDISSLEFVVNRFAIPNEIVKLIYTSRYYTRPYSLLQLQTFYSVLSVSRFSKFLNK
jgi:hypothetical protein